MKTFLIVYDLSAPGQKYAEITKYIKDTFQHTKPLNTTWMIKSSHSAEKLTDALSTFIDEDDKLFVVALGDNPRDAAWNGLDNASEDWIQANL